MGKWERSAEKGDAICLLVGKTTPQEPKSGGESQKKSPKGHTFLASRKVYRMRRIRRLMWCMTGFFAEKSACRQAGF